MTNLNESGPRQVIENPTPRPANEDVFGAAMRQGNSVVSALSAIHNSGTFEPVEGYSAWDRIKDDPELLPHAFRFGGVTSPAQADNLADRIRGENADKRLLAQSGAAGIVSGLVAGALDPTMFLPGRVAVGIAKDGLPWVRAAAEMGGAMALQSTAQELALHASQETRTGEESIINVGSSTLLGALLGSAVGALSKGEHAALVSGLDHERATMAAHAAGEPPPARPAFPDPSMEARPAPTPIQPEITDTGGAQDARFTDPATGGNLTLYLGTEGKARVYEAKVPEEARGQGVGAQLYENAIRWAAENGREFSSDAYVSESARRVYEGLKRRGYEVTQAADAVEKDGGLAVKSGPVFTVRQKATPPSGFVHPDTGVPRGPLAAEVAPHHLPSYDEGYRGEPRRGNDSEVAAWDRGANDRMNADREAYFAARSAGAATTDERDLQLVGAGGVERFALDAKTRGMTSPLESARRVTADLGEIPLLTRGNLRGETTALQGLPVETDWKIATRTFTTGVMSDITENWKDLRFGGEKAPWFAAFRDRMNMLGRPAHLPTQEEFGNMVGEAMSKGDVSTIPQVQAAAQAIRKRMEPWADRAEKAIEGYQKREGEPYFPHYWNKKLIKEMRPEFVNFLTNKFAADQAEKAVIQQRMQAHANSLEVHEDQIKKLTGTIERKHDALDEAEARAEEVQRFNKFAYQRSEKLSEPLDEKAAKIRDIETKIRPQLDKLEKLAEDIKAETEEFPEIKEADALIFKMIGAAQKLKQSKELIDAVDAASEYVDALGPVIEGFRGGIREASAAAKLARRELGADTLVTLENSRTATKKEIAPLLKELNATRKALKEERAARLPGARGGAVFETKIRERGNVIADQLSGKRAEIEDLETKLTNEHLNANAVRERIEAEIGKWEGNSTKEAKAAIKARDKYEAERTAAAAAAGKPKPTERLRSADSAVDKAVKRIIESAQDLTIPELRDRAHATTDHILGHPDGRLYGEGSDFGLPTRKGDDLRGSEVKRQLNVSNAEAWPWIEQNAEHAATQWAKTFQPDVLIAEKFGDVAMTEPRQKILKEHADRTDATKNAKERLALDKAKDIALDDLAFMRDKMRGTLNVPADRVDTAILRASGVARNVNVITSMGVSGLASLADSGTVMMRHGLMHTFADGFMPYFRSLLSGGEFNREALRQAKAAAIAIDWDMASRHHELAGVLDGYKPRSTAERALQWGADKMQLLNMLAPWTDRIKTITMTVAAPDIKRALEARLKGTATAKQLRQLGEGNIPAHMDERIIEQYEKYGGEVGGVMLPSIDKWTDEAAQRHMQGALVREADISVVTPGIGDTPNWMSKPILGMLGQFKSYTAASHTRILIANLQRRDADVLSGLVGMMGIGMLSYKLNALTGGQPTSDRPQDWIKEAMSRSNMFGWFEESNAFASKMTRGQLDAYRLTGSDHMLSKYAGRSVTDQILGPTIGKIERLSQVSGAAARMDWTASDTHALRQLLFFQNLVYVRGLLNQVEEGSNNAFGIPKKEAKQ